MPGFSIVLNSVSDPLTNSAAELDLSSGAVNNGIGYRLLEPLGFPLPAAKPNYASSYSTEGSIASDEAHYDNREITIRLRVAGSSAADFEGKLNALLKHVGQINREGGNLKLTTPNSTVCYFDLVPEAAAVVDLTNSYVGRNRTDVECRFVARPFWRASPTEYTNLITNPSFGTDTAGWGQIQFTNATTLTRTSTLYSPSGFYLNIDCNADGAFEGVETPIDLVAGRTYAYSVMVARLAGSDGIHVLIVDRTTSGTLANTAIGAGTDWQTITGTFVATDGGPAIFLVRHNNVTSANDFGIAAAMVTEIPAGTTAPSFFDGHTGPTTWNGLPHGSTSELRDVGIVDDFSADTIASGKWTFDSGAGTLGITAGQMAPSSASTKRLYRNDRTFYDAQASLHVPINTGINLAGVRVILRRRDANNYLFANVYGTGGAERIEVSKIENAVETVLAGTTSGTAVGSAFWIVFRVEGNDITGEFWASRPTPTGTATATATATLGSFDLHPFGAGVSGQAGIGLDATVPTTWRFDSFAVTPNVYVERTLPWLTLGGP